METNAKMKLIILIQLLIFFRQYQDVIADSMVKCKQPTAPDFGGVQLHGDSNVGSTIIYYCNKNKKILGETVSKCLVTGQWSYDPPKCLNYCTVPDIENGDMGIATEYISRFRKKDIFEKISAGEEVYQDEKLTLQCAEDYSPSDGQKFLENNKVEVTCKNGTWSRIPQCLKMVYCFEPPDPENGRVMYSSLIHGAELNYQCNTGYKLETNEPRYCSEDGSWSNVEPKCIEIRCEEPIAPVHGGFHLIGDPKVGNLIFYFCDEDKRMVGERISKCLKTGQWTYDPPKCLNNSEGEIIPTIHSAPEITKHTATENASDSSIHPTTGLEHPRECYCTYYRADHLIRATVKSKVLKDGDKVKQGETVNFVCLHTGFLAWQNGLVLDSRSNVTCTTCQIWNKNDNPKCHEPEYGQPFISLHNSFKIKPGGAIEVEAGKFVEMWCVSSDRHPEWYFHGKSVTNVARIDMPAGFHMVFSYFEINKADVQDSGIYECVATVDSPYPLRTVVDLQVKNIRCPEIEEDDGLIIKYDMERRESSQAHFSCPPNREIIGKPELTCLKSGHWSDSPPRCSAIRCKTLQDTDLLKIYYSESREVDSVAIFHCFRQGKRSGISYTRCLPNGTWEHPEPTCSETNEARTIPPVLLEKASTISTDVPITTRPSVGGLELTNTSSFNTEAANDCYCTYERENSVIVRTENKTLKYGDKVKLGETVSFNCEDDKVLSWENGLRVYGTSNVTCTTCEKWRNPRNPACTAFQQGTPFIVLTYPLKLLSKGIAIADDGVTFRLLCGSTFTYPTWITPDSRAIQDKFISGGRISVYFFSSLIITASSDQANGKYDCTVPRQDNKTTLEIEVKSPGCSIADLSKSLPTGVIPDLKDVTGEYISTGSEMRLKCEGNLIFVGNSTVECKNNGKWRMENPQCVSVPGCLLKLHESSSLAVHPRKDIYRLGEHIVLSCPYEKELTSEVKRLMCLGERGWSHPVPDCKLNK